MDDGERYSLAAQLERTVLAWNRSALAIGANGALLVHQGFSRDLPAATVAGFAVVAVGVLVWAVSIGRYASALDRRASHLIADRHHLVLAAAWFLGLLSVGDLLLVAIP